MRRAYKYRLYPNANQLRELEQQLETHRRLYNQALAQRINAYTACQLGIRWKPLSVIDQQHWFKDENKRNPWYGRISADAALATLRRLDRSYQNFFRRVKQRAAKVGFPRFKAKERFDSIEYPHAGTNNGIGLIESRLRVKHVGNIKVKLHRPIEGQIKTASLKLEAGKWFVMFSCDLGDVQVEPSTNPAVGIDVGIESFAYTSDGESIPNPSYLKKELPELRRRSRTVARRRKGGSNRRKAVRRLRATHVRVKNLRREYHHQTSLKLVRRYGVIAMESLNVRGMLKSRWMSRAISDAGWSAFMSTLKCKAESAGVEIVEVNPSYTSQQCSGCGALISKKLRERTHHCDQCGLVLHRDENAARNILARALQVRTGPAGPQREGLKRSCPENSIFANRSTVTANRGVAKIPKRRIWEKTGVS